MGLTIKILGTGCSNCKNLEKLTLRAIEDLKLDAKVEKIEDIQKIMTYGVMRTPALVINEKIALNGRVPDLKELKEIFVNYSTLV